jgi:Protein of unknown function (DUF2393)
MQQLDPNPLPPSQPASMFNEPTPARSFPTAAVAIAAVALAILVTVLVLLGRRHEAKPASNTVLPAAAYASNLVLSDLQMSESSSMSGGKQTYIEGHIVNHGPSTVTGITIQVVFANDVRMPPQVETGPLNMIYMRDPYVDTRPVSASPLAPGAQGDFRLIFDDINDNWNQQLPQVNVTHVDLR